MSSAKGWHGRLPARLRNAVAVCAAVVRDGRVRRSIDGVSTAGEVIALLPFAALGLAVLDAVAGSMPALMLTAAVYLRAGRASIRAVCWVSGGIYIGWLLLSAGSALARRAGDPLTGESEAMLSLALYAGGLAALALTIGLPLSRMMARWAPALSRATTTWATELGKGGLAGASLGVALASVLSPAPPLGGESPAGRILVVGLASSIGLVVGGLRADSRVRVRAGGVERGGTRGHAA